MSSRDLWIPALPRGIRARLLDPGTRPAREARPGLVRSGVSTLSSILSAWTARPVGLGIDAERILNFAGEGIYTVDLQGRCTFVNAAAASMLHTDVHVLLSRNIHQFHHDPDLRDEECPVCMPLSAGQAANRDDQFFVRGNGTRFPIEYTSTSIVGRGEVVRIVTFKDVSARKEVEDALRQSEMKFRAVAESANDAIVSAGPNGLIVAWNRGAQLIFGYTEDEAVGQSLTILMPAMYRDAHKSGIERFQMTGDPHVIGSTVQVEGQRKDGTVFPLELSLAYWDRDGERYFTGIIRDITERRNAELALQREVSFVRLLKSIAQASNEATDARDALSLSLAAICDHANWPVGHAYVTDPDDPTRLIPSEIWYFRDHAGYEDFQRATGDMPLSAGIGLPGRVLLEGRPAWISDVTEDPNFPATRHLPPLFNLTDEFYQVKNFSREKSRVLLRLDTSKLPHNENLLNKDGDFPLAWAKMYGQGRVFYGSFAHDAKLWDNPDVYHMYFEAIKWALKLTDADVAPRPLPASVTPLAK